MKSGKTALWKRLLAAEIGIEFKASLYFLCILAYYCIYRIACGSTQADIIHMTQMVLATYIMGYIQVYLLSNFDEGDELKIREIIYLILCSLTYTIVACCGKWFDGKLGVCIGFFCYIMFAYACAFFIYKFKRTMDEKKLNADLKSFKERKCVNENGD